MWSLLVLIVVCGVALYLVNQVIPMQPPFKTILNVVVGIFVVLYVLYFFGVPGMLDRIGPPGRR